MSDNPSDFLMRVIGGYRFSIAVGLAAQLGLADHLKDGPLSGQELSRLTETHPDTLHRFLRYLVGIGVLAEGPQGCFALTPTGALLRSDHPAAVRRTVLMHTSEPFLNAWGQLPYSVRTGESAFNHVYGTGMFEYAQANPSFGRVVDQSFTAGAGRQVSAIVDAYDFSGFRRVADVGGGNGAFLAAILNRNKHVRGVLFDLPQVVERAAAVLQSSGVADRCEVVGGSFFDAVPAGCDAYTLKAVIHDWDDARALTILRNCRAAMAPGSKLLVIGAVLPEVMDSSPASAMASFGDMEMLVMAGGRERTESDLRRLFEAAGLRLSRLIPVPTAFVTLGGTIAEGVPV